MKKNIISNITICLLVTITFLIIYYSNSVIESIGFSISIWRDNLFPSLFPFFIISNLLLQYGFVEKVGVLFKKIMPNIFHLPKEASYALVISMFSGFPSGAKAVTDLVKSKIISRQEGERLLTFTHYSNPLFIIGFMGSILLNDKKIGYIILFSHVISGLITGYLFRIKTVSIDSDKKNNTITTLPSFGNALRKSIFDSLNTMFLLLGIVSIFLVLTTIIFEIVDLNPTNKTIVAGILEMTQGIKLANGLGVSLLVKAILMTIFLSFGGISIHMQVLSIISQEKIKYRYFLMARLCHSLLASVFVYGIYNLFY